MGVCLALILTSQQSPVAIYTENRARMLRVNAINRQELLKQLTFHPKSLIFKTVSVPCLFVIKISARIPRCIEPIPLLYSPPIDIMRQSLYVLSFERLVDIEL